LKKWLIDHIENPYLKYVDKIYLTKETGLDGKQIQNWFTNVRKVSFYCS
jgi:Homeobox KN domain